MEKKRKEEQDHFKKTGKRSSWSIAEREAAKVAGPPGSSSGIEEEPDDNSGAITASGAIKESGAKAEQQHREQIEATKKTTEAVTQGSDKVVKNQEKVGKKHIETYKKEKEENKNNLKKSGVLDEDSGYSGIKNTGDNLLNKKGQRLKPQETGFTSLEKSVLGGGGGPISFSFAGGGTIPGQGDNDSVAAMLTPGEFVVNKKASQKYAKLLSQLNTNKFNVGGPVASPAITMGGAGGFSPKIGINVRGDSVNMIMKSVTGQLQQQLNSMMTPAGTSSRYFDIPRSG